MRTRIPIALTGFLLTFVARASAAVEAGADVTFASQYVARGVTEVNRPVLQPGLWVSESIGDLSVTGYLWSNVELGQYDARSALSLGGGARAMDLSELDPGLELSWASGEVEFLFGGNAYLYPNGSGATHDDDGAEVYAQVTVPGWLGLSHSLALAWDVTEISGRYYELGTSRGFEFGAERTVVGSFALGWSDGMAVRTNGAGDEREPGGFASDGLTHVELGLALPFEWLALSVEPSAHVSYGHDDWAKGWSGTSERDVKAWVGLTFSGSVGGEE